MRWTRVDYWMKKLNRRCLLRESTPVIKMKIQSLSFQTCSNVSNIKQSLSKSRNRHPKRGVSFKQSEYDSCEWVICFWWVLKLYKVCNWRCNIKLFIISNRFILFMVYSYLKNKVKQKATLASKGEPTLAKTTVHNFL